MDNAAVLAQLAALQSQVAAQKTSRDGFSVWAVFNPKQVGVWCEKSGCPVTGRRSKLETVKLRKSQTMSAFLTDDEAEEETSVETEEEEEYEVKVLRDSGNQNAHHRLGVVAAFPSERGARDYIKSYYEMNQAILAAMPVEDVPLFEIEEIKVF
ncbi:MAG: hypothetical protein CME55_06600 [Halieaceae bacterium]|nr:hypothetical protein [Halieaceae bacterium]